MSEGLDPNRAGFGAVAGFAVNRPGYAELEVKHDFSAEAGELVCKRTGGVHQVRKKSNQVTLSLHTYGKHVDHSNRSPFDLQS